MAAAYWTSRPISIGVAVRVAQLAASEIREAFADAELAQSGQRGDSPAKGMARVVGGM